MNVENPLTTHLVLNVQSEKQLVHSYGTHAVILCYLSDGDGLRAAQDDACVVGQRFLLCSDFFEQGVFAFPLSVVLLEILGFLFQFVSSVLSDSRQDFGSDPTFESSCAI